jgi:asparagine synthase (glutamine-hydrolysing)
MCGLAGILSMQSNRDILSNVSKMTSRLIHRGPDDYGYWCEQNIGMGHRRLSVIDLTDTGAQPMKSSCGRFIIVYNGEIYNHHELRKSLNNENNSLKWQGRSDTETLLNSIIHWGVDEALCKLKGMFAFALWDKAEMKLVLARDRIGEKPLYWGWAGKDFIFGSELKSLHAHPECPKSVCIEALTQYLRFLYIPAPRSIHPGIYKLEPGTILTITNDLPTEPPKKPIRPGEKYGSLSIRRYFNLNSEIENGIRNLIQDEHEAIFETERVLAKAVKSQMNSDVPLGAFLSGGVDSSLIVALMQKQSEKAIQTFTIGFEEQNYDESNHAAAVAKHIGTIHTKMEVNATNAKDIIYKLPSIYDEPFADSSQIPTHIVSSLARKHVTVALSGDGGDEFFGGYNKYIHGPKLWSYMSCIPFPLRILLGQLLKKIPMNLWDFFGNGYNKIRLGSKGIGDLENKINLLSDRMQYIQNIDDLYFNMSSVAWTEPTSLCLNKVKEPHSQLNDNLPEAILRDPVMRMMAQDMRSYLPDDILCKVDRAAMAVSLETRTPFLDPEMISLSMRIPSSMKINNNEGKKPLREVLYKYVPKELIDRPKAGFKIPIGNWLRGHLREWAEANLSKQRLSNEGYMNPDIIQNIWKEHLSGKKDWTSKLWPILMFQTWKDEIH